MPASAAHQASALIGVALTFGALAALLIAGERDKQTQRDAELLKKEFDKNDLVALSLLRWRVGSEIYEYVLKFEFAGKPAELVRKSEGRRAIMRTSVLKELSDRSFSQIVRAARHPLGATTLIVEEAGSYMAGNETLVWRLVCKEVGTSDLGAALSASL